MPIARPICAVLACVFLAACGGGGTTPAPVPSATAAPTPIPKPLTASYVFAGDPSGKTTVEYGRAGTAPIATLSATGAPNALAFDAQGNIYVAFGGATVEEHAAGTHRLLRKITGFHHVNDIALDGKGLLYAIDGSAPDGTAQSPSHLWRVVPGTTSPSVPLLTLPAPSNGNLISLAVDAGGTVYVGADTGGMYVFAPGATVPTRTFSVDLPANSLAFNRAGNLFIYAAAVIGGEIESTIDEFVPGSNKPLSSYNANSLGITPQSLAFDVSNDSYVISDPYVTYLGQQITGNVIENSSTGASLPVLPFNFPVALAVDPMKNLYVLDSDTLDTQPTGTAEHLSEFSFADNVATRTFESSGSAIGLSNVP